MLDTQGYKRTLRICNMYLLLFHGHIGNVNALHCCFYTYLTCLVMETEYVWCTVRTGSLNVSQINPLKTEKSESTVLFSSFRCPKERCFWKVPRLRPCVLLVRKTYMGYWWNDIDRNLTCIVAEGTAPTAL
jgi:hypothetical protein